MISEEQLRFALAAAALAFVLALLQRHPRRVLGLTPIGLTITACSFAWLNWSRHSTGAWCGIGFGAILAFVPLARYGLGDAVYRGPSLAMTNVLAIAIMLLTPISEKPAPAQSWLAHTAIAASAAALAWWLLYSQAIELFTSTAFWPFYRVRTHGPGARTIPRTGPLLIVANHSAYFDPFWLGKIIPRHMTPMMTSLFYDLPGIRWLMVHVVGAIRVEESLVRREAPELHEAVEVLRQGGCIVVFPEAILRRTEERLLRPFGQGVWHILRELPETPVVVCWIEGGWGSYFSYRGGPPGKNKRLDVRRPIDIAVEEARPLDPAVLVDHMTTRQHLRRAVATARGHLGLPVPDDSGRVTTLTNRTRMNADATDHRGSDL